MSNQATRRRIAALIVIAAAAGLAASCSAVFRSSIQGSVIDLEDWDDGTTTGVADAKIFLYTDDKARDADYDAFVDGDESTLPDGAARTERQYFQSTVTDADGGYDFTGFIWESLFPKYGKTADRDEVFFLIYHPDYGLWKNPTPLYVVSDVTNNLDYIKIEDLWNEGRLAGTVLDWKDDDGLAGATVSFYVAESWDYDASGGFTSVVYPTAPTATTTTDADGAWVATVRFPMEPDRSTHAAHNDAPVRIAYTLTNYRCNDDEPGDTGLTNASIVTDADLDRDGRTAAQGDYEDAYVQATLEYDADEGEAVLGSAPTVTMQRWRFSATVAGTVVDNADGITGINGVTVDLAVKDREYSADSAPVDTAASTEDGRFDLGTIVWEIGDVSDSADWKVGEVTVTMTTTGAALVSGGIATLKPDAQRNLTLRVTP
ncbi:MAG: hypothetical protein H7A27_11660 [Spirochaetaceae bacterium]|nr:hypothetical protein [Spirochaetaceae bacterium]